MFDKNILFVCNIIKHYLSSVLYFINIAFLYLFNFVPDFVLDCEWPK